MAAYPWSTGDANAARSAPFTGERCAQAANGCHWGERWLPYRAGTTRAIEMMLAESCRVATRMPASRALPTTVRTPRGRRSIWLALAFRVRWHRTVAPSEIPHSPLTPSTLYIDATRIRYVDFPKLTHRSRVSPPPARPERRRRGGTPCRAGCRCGRSPGSTPDLSI